MSDYHRCPHCGREAKKAFSSNWFPVYRCPESNCHEVYCHECGKHGCPKCGSTQHAPEIGKVYAR